MLLGNTTWLPKCELHKHDINKNAKMGGKILKRPLPYAKSYRQLSKALSLRGGPTQERAHGLVVHWQILSSENIYSSNIIRTQQIVFSKICVYK